MRKRFGSLLLAALMLVLCMTLTACSSRTWEGEWNRVGDSTFSRATVNIKNVKSDGFTFSLTVYNGNLAGRLENVRAIFYDTEKTAARYYIPDTDCYIDFAIDGKYINIYFGADQYENYVDEENDGVAVLLTEETVMGFKSGGYVGGQYTRGKVEYLNESLAQMGVCEPLYDDQLRGMMTADMYMRMMDCFQQFETIRHDDIGGYITYGSNVLQPYSAALICYDDQSVSVVITTEIGGIVYYTNNHIYTNALLPYPLSDWIKLYNGEVEE